MKVLLTQSEKEKEWLSKDNDGFANIYEDENINAAKAETVVKLAKSLNCIVEALMEVV